MVQAGPQQEMALREVATWRMTTCFLPVRFSSFSRLSRARQVSLNRSLSPPRSDSTSLRKAISIVCYCLPLEACLQANRKSKLLCFHRGSAEVRRWQLAGLSMLRA